MLQIPNEGRYEGFDCAVPTGERYRAHSFGQLVEKVQRKHPEVSESWMEADWCNRHPGRCVELPGIPTDAPSRTIAYLQAMGPRASSKVAAIPPEVYERDRIGVCLTFNNGQPCDQWRGEKYIGLISCKACNCRFLKAWAVSTKCKLGRWKA